MYIYLSPGVKMFKSIPIQKCKLYLLSKDIKRCYKHMLEHTHSEMPKQRITEAVVIISRP